jgi:hypothetical protein
MNTKHSCVFLVQKGKRRHWGQLIARVLNFIPVRTIVPRMPIRRSPYPKDTDRRP